MATFVSIDLYTYVVGILSYDFYHELVNPLWLTITQRYERQNNAGSYLDDEGPLSGKLFPPLNFKIKVPHNALQTIL